MAKKRTSPARKKSERLLHPTFNQKRRASRGATTIAGGVLGAVAYRKHPIAGASAGAVVGNRIGAFAYPYRGAHKKGRFHTTSHEIANSAAAGVVGYAAGSHFNQATGVAGAAVAAGSTYQVNRNRRKRRS